MAVSLTKRQRQRWIDHMRYAKRLSSGIRYNSTSWIAENRDPHDVETVLRSICRYGYSVFYYRHIRKYFSRVNGTKPVSRVCGVNVLHALWMDGFIDIEKNRDGNRSRYTRLFDVKDWEQVLKRVVDK